MHDTRTRGPILAPPQVEQFRESVSTWYRHNRRALPWRETADPYAILVSEIMLQQTQVDRVVGRYCAFLAVFPDVAALAAAPLGKVLGAWQGLGYNRRAIALKKCAENVVGRHAGTLPSSVEELQELPGIGHYTARAIAAFAFGLPTVFIETNIRAVFIHHFFGDHQDVRDSEMLPLVAETLDRDNPRDWYNALMDYGAMLKKTFGNPARRSAHHASQPPFKGSNRQLRGRILKALLATPRLTERALISLLDADAEKIRTNLVQLEREGFIERRRGRFLIRPD